MELLFGLRGSRAGVHFFLSFVSSDWLTTCLPTLSTYQTQFCLKSTCVKRVVDFDGYFMVTRSLDLSRVRRHFNKANTYKSRAEHG